MKINKRFLQFIAAVWILAFHLWVPITATESERFIVLIGYVGVDLFFFLSAYSLADKEIDYKSFLIHRVVVLYVKFAIFVGLMAIAYISFRREKIWKALTFVDLFETGGGAFLWFIPAIILFYLVYPFFVKWDNKGKIMIILLGWLFFSVLLEQLAGYTKIFIFTNRIPIIMIGYACKKYSPKIRQAIPNVWVNGLSVAALPVGLILLYYYGYYRRLHVPIHDAFYLLAIPVVLFFAWISSYVKNNRVWDVLGSVTLELYALQMIYGTKIALHIYVTVKNPVSANLGTFIVLFVLAYGLNVIFKIAERWILKRKK
ncbi:MAG: acyltransferase [Lachnospiraceae bacterium]|nr:acyltransferase [Lachnospiraceae bacterium]